MIDVAREALAEIEALGSSGAPELGRADDWERSFLLPLQQMFERLTTIQAPSRTP